MPMFDFSSKVMNPGDVMQGTYRLPSTAKRAMPTTEARGFSLDERMEYLRAYGSHCMSSSLLQPGMEYFDMPGKGFIAYRSKWGAKMTLADPVCDEKDRETLIGEFLSRYRNVGFVQITEPVAELMNQAFGFYATQFGIETVVDLENWTLSGKKKQVLRTAVNQARKKGVAIREGSNDTNYRELSDQWITTRKIKNREIGFLIRPMEMDHQPDTRKFFAYINDELIGFIFFDPVYKDGEIISYVPNISRFSNSFRQGIFYSIMTYAMEKFKSEGIKELNLGLSILILNDDDRPHESRVLKNIERLIYRYGNFIYSFKGIEFTKSRFQGRTNRFYCAHKGFLPAIKLISVFKLANVF
ncbi:MAG: DUF2156 domain-containing protein [Desulfobacterales bacterium]|nr:DUF2156 domain-containing protein [Desulfobacterales bacterium]